MGYHYSERDIENMYAAGILHRSNSPISSETRRIIEQNTACPKCGAKGVKVIGITQDDAVIRCQKCQHEFK